jgi:hypothetical protein
MPPADTEPRGQQHVWRSAAIAKRLVGWPRGPDGGDSNAEGACALQNTEGTAPEESCAEVEHAWSGSGLARRLMGWPRGAGGDSTVDAAHSGEGEQSEGTGATEHAWSGSGLARRLVGLGGASESSGGGKASEAVCGAVETNGGSFSQSSQPSCEASTSAAKQPGVKDAAAPELGTSPKAPDAIVMSTTLGRVSEGPKLAPLSPTATDAASTSCARSPRPADTWSGGRLLAELGPDITVTDCGHVFHTVCLLSYEKFQMSRLNGDTGAPPEPACPVCRRDYCRRIGAVSFAEHELAHDSQCFSV